MHVINLESRQERIFREQRRDLAPPDQQKTGVGNKNRNVWRNAQESALVSMTVGPRADWPFCRWVWAEGQLAPELAVSQSENSLSLWSAHLALGAQSHCYVWALLCHGSITWQHRMWKSPCSLFVCMCCISAGTSITSSAEVLWFCLSMFLLRNTLTRLEMQELLLQETEKSTYLARC